MKLMRSSRDRRAKGQLASIAGLTALLLSSSALAQVAQAGKASTEVEVVTVTAQKRVQSAQDVPIAISAFGQNILNQKGAVDILSLENQVPTLQINLPQGVVRISMRGAGNDSVSTGSDNAVAFNFDSIYLGNAAASLSDIWDVERVEILRGPQGTLFGRNATGGSINIIPVAPQDTFSAKGDFTYGNYNLYRLRGAVNVPLSDEVAARVSFTRTYHDGYLKNTYPGGKNKDNADAYTVRAQLAIRPTDDLNIKLAFISDKNDDLSNQPVRVGPKYPTGGPFSPLLTAVYATTLPKNPSPWVTRQNYPGKSLTDFTGGYATMSWDMNTVTLKSISGYFDTDRQVNSDWDDSELSLFALHTRDQSSQFSQEFQLLSNDSNSPVEWIVGANYFYFRDTNDVLLNLGEIEKLPSPFFGTNIFQTIHANLRAISWAGYGQVSVKLTDKLKVTGGFRYTWDKKASFTTAHPPVLPGVPPTVPPANFVVQYPIQGSWSAPTGKFSVVYDVDKDRRLYASYSRGYRTAAINPSDNTNPIANPEYVNSYEAGLKSYWFGHRLRVNLSAYLAQYQDIQINTFPSSNAVLVNIPGGKVYGLEGTFDALPFDYLEIDGSFGLTKSKYDHYVTGNPGMPGPLGTPTPQDIGGNKFIETPEVSLALGAMLTVPTGIGPVRFRVDEAYRSKVDFEIFANPDMIQKGYTKTDLRVMYDAPNGKWGVDLWAKNLEDNSVATTLLRPGAALGPDVPLAWYAPPRTFGVTLKANW